MRKPFTPLLAPLLALFLVAGAAQAEPEQYNIDKGHTFITFEISHIGFAFLPGTFNDFDGTLTFDPENPENSKTEFTIQTASIDTEHAERDKHLRNDDFFDVKKYPTAKFVSTSYERTGEDTATLTGELTLKDVTKDVVLDVTEVNAAEDPWGNFRRAFVATTEITLKDFNIDYDLGPASRTAELKIAVEAVKQ